MSVTSIGAATFNSSTQCSGCRSRGPGFVMASGEDFMMMLCPACAEAVALALLPEARRRGLQAMDVLGQGGDLTVSYVTMPDGTERKRWAFVPRRDMSAKWYDSATGAVLAAAKAAGVGER